MRNAETIRWSASGSERPKRAQRLGPPSGPGRRARRDLPLPRLVAHRLGGREARPHHPAPRADRPCGQGGLAVRATAFPRLDDGVLLLSLAHDGRLTNPRTLEILRDRVAGVTDCFVFCPGWLEDSVEGREA